MKNLLHKSGSTSSRQQIQIKEVMDNILVLPNNEYRQILETSSVNFDSKAKKNRTSSSTASKTS